MKLLDQTRLPWEVVFVELHTPSEVSVAIREMRVRGAPAIGVTAAYGLVLATAGGATESRDSLLSNIRDAHQVLAASRPTAVNLRWALDRMLRTAEATPAVADLPAVLLAEAHLIHLETQESDLSMGAFGAPLIPPGSTVLTHCNTGALATGGYGTALGVIHQAWKDGRVVKVLATETRPWLQGARLTTWELANLGIPYTLMVDSAAGYAMSQGSIQCVVVGADRIASNGDVANKIGTCSLAILAHQCGVPFYVAAPFSTIDLSIGSGRDIPIEERPPEEVTLIRGNETTLPTTPVWNPAFDVTPNRYVSAIITDRGVARAAYDASLQGLVQRD